MNARANAVVSLATVNNISLKGTNLAVNARRVVVAISASHTLTIDHQYKRISSKPLIEFEGVSILHRCKGRKHRCYQMSDVLL